MTREETIYKILSDGDCNSAPPCSKCAIVHSCDEADCCNDNEVYELAKELSVAMKIKSFLDND
jgi:hypothetical protein